MSPRSKAKAKETAANGSEKRVRESRNVKAASYKDLSDSEDEKPVRRRKRKESESESMSEDEKPKKRTPKGRRGSTRSRKEESDSEEVSDFVSEESSGEDSRKKKKPARKPARSLRNQQKTSYKDLTDSEEDSNEDEEGEDYDSSDKDEKSSNKKRRGRPLKSSKKTKKEELSESESEEAEEEEGEEEEEEEEEEVKEPKKPSSEKKSSAASEPSSEPVAKAKTDSVKKADAEKQARPEHDLSENDDEKEEEEEEHESNDEDKTETKEGKSGPKKREREPLKNQADKEVKGEKEPAAKKAKVEEKSAMNKTETDYGSIDLSSEAKNKDGDLWNFKISSWNVAGFRACLKKGFLEFVKHEKPDILCLQETKVSIDKLPPESKIDGYHPYWLSGEKEGYAGVAVLSKKEPIEVKYGLGKPEFDSDGRVITAEFEKFFVVNVYVPNAGQGLKTLPQRLEWDPAFRAHLKALDEKKPVILCGDLNVAHNEIDLANPKANVTKAGFTPEERKGMTELLKEGFVDTFRNLYPDKKDAYSFWTYMGNARSRNVGWRLDYFITSERFLPSVCDNVMRSDVLGSDHCPISLLLHI